MSKARVYFLETRPQFLLLSVVLIILGTAMAWNEGFFSWYRTVLALVGLVALHISVNVLNDYFDYRSGIDLATQRTPFSGGSGILPGGMLPPRSVLIFGLAAFAVAVPIGAYFLLVSGWWLLPLLAAGAVSVLIYTQYLTRVGGGVGEAAAGLGLGTLPALGAYFCQTGFYTWHAVIASIPSGILVCNLLFLNEFPDAAADLKGKRRTLPIVMGKRAASRLYAALTVLVYAWIVGGVVARLLGLPGLPLLSLVALLTLPLAVKAIAGAFGYEQPARLLPALASNVMVILLTQLLLGLGFVGDRFIQGISSAA